MESVFTLKNKKVRRRDRVRRALGIFLSAALVFSLVPAGGLTVHASEGEEGLDAANAAAASFAAASGLDLSNSGDSGDLSTDNYHWNPSSKTLELKDAAISGTVTLPDAAITIETTGNCSIDTLAIAIAAGYGGPNNVKLTFSGDGELTIKEKIDISGGDGLTITVAAGARVVADGGIYIGSSGGVNSTVSVYGTLTARGAGVASAINSGKVVVGAGGELNVSGENGVALNGISTATDAFAGVFTVERGGCFSADCENFNVQVRSGTGNPFPEGSGADQAFNIPEGYLPTDCEPRQNGGVINLVRISTGEVYTGPLMIHENHNWPDTWNGKDEAGHWKICTYEGCDKTNGYEAHHFDNDTGICVCGSTLDVALNGASGLIYNGQEHKPGVAVALDGTVLDASKYQVAYQNNKNAGEASVTVTGKDGLTFERTVKFQIARATPAVTWGSRVQTVTYSGSPARIVPPAVTLAGGGNFDGELTYSYAASGSSGYTPGLPVNAGTYSVKADVAMQGNYNAADSADTLTLTVEKAENAPNMPSGTMNVERKYSKVSTVELPAGWQWQETDKNTALKPGVPLKVTAVYVGADKANYKNVTGVVTIIRAKSSAGGSSKGSHDTEDSADAGNDSQVTGGEAAAAPQERAVSPSAKSGGTRGATVSGQPEEEHIHDYSVTVEKEATCTEEGVKRYVCSCKDSYTESIPALGHDYQEEITEQPTVSSEGVKTYTCSRCGDTYTEPIDRLEDAVSEPDSHPESAKTSMPWWILIVVILAALAGAVWFFVKKREKEEAEEDA